jgi:hypothetical protein
MLLSERGKMIDRLGRLALGVLCASFLAANLGATPIGTGNLGLSGNFEVTQTALFFGLQNPPATPNNQQALINLGTGAFSGLMAGQIATIQNITSQPSFPSGAINVPQWITLPDGIDLDLTNVVYDTTVPICSTTGGSDGVGTTCRVMIGTTQSPILLTQNATGVYAQLALLGNAYSGSSSSGTTPFNGVLSATFSQPGQTTISGLLGTFSRQGFVGTNYAANFSVTLVPEPGMLAGVGLGMLVLGSLRRKIRPNKG